MIWRQRLISYCIQPRIAISRFSLVCGTVLTSLLLLREALRLAPFPSREACWGLGLTVLDSTQNR